MSALAAAIAERLAERILGIRKPRVLSTQVSEGAGGVVRLQVSTDEGTVCLTASAADGSGCHDCGRPYGDEFGFPDLVVPHDVWNRYLSPAGHEGGLLCPSCMCARAYAAGLIGVPARFMSGPFATEAADA